MPSTDDLYVCEREREKERELLECSGVHVVLLEKKRRKESEDRAPYEVLEKIETRERCGGEKNRGKRKRKETCG